MIGLLGCAVCGLSVGIMWPGTFSKASAGLPRGGTALFVLMALAGDLGCSDGPTLVGMISGALGEDLRRGILAGAVFPALLLMGLRFGKARTDSIKVRRQAAEGGPRPITGLRPVHGVWASKFCVQQGKKS